MSVPLHLKFGYATMIEKEAIRQRLLTAGAVEDMTLLFAVEAEYLAVEAEYLAAHANDVPYRDKKPRSATAQAQFTAEELIHLVEHFANANDPISASIHQKARILMSNANDGRNGRSTGQ